MEKQDDGAYAILADDTNKVYYKITITSYEYNQWNIEENTLLENLAVKEKSTLSVIGLIPVLVPIKKLKSIINGIQLMNSIILRKKICRSGVAQIGGAITWD